MDQTAYRLHIDGIRAIAVFSVVLFHLEYRFIPGGFVGVDVFFVISGYLITRLIHKDVKQGIFSFKSFYLRRFRRLAPALLATLIGTFAVAVVFLTPHHFQRFCGALLSSVFSVSNFYFWSESGYFDASAELKPLLHTWSLSVEEQFYLLWPALIFLCRPLSGRQLLAVFIALGIVSLLAAKIMFPQSPSATFYLMPFRIYEFAIGAALALLPALDKLNNRYREALTVIGCALIVYSVLAFDKRTPFPELNALLPCLGAACLIVGGMATYSGWLLRNPVSVFVGKISYSLYLVHWPIVVLYKHISFEDVVVGKTRIALFILTLIAAVMLNRLVENRFRYAPEKRPRKSLTMLLVWWAMPVLIALASLHAYAIDGWSGRFDRQVIQAIGDVEAKQLIRRQYIETPQSLSNLPFDQAAPVKILIMGDSHATDAFNALHLANPAPDSVSVRRLEIDDVCLYLLEPGAVSDEPEHVQRRCREHWRFVQSSPLLDQSNWVVISTRWERASFAYLPIFIDYLQSRDNQVILMGRTAEFKNVPSLVLKYGLGEGIGAALAADRDVSIDALNDELKSLGDSLAVAYIDKLPHLCELSQSICDVIDADGRILYTDYGHWSIEGAHYFGKKIWSDSELGGLLGID